MAGARHHFESSEMQLFLWTNSLHGLHISSPNKTERKPKLIFLNVGFYNAEKSEVENSVDIIAVLINLIICAMQNICSMHVM